MAGITYIAKFADGTYATRYSDRHLRPQYTHAWRAGFTVENRVGTWRAPGVYPDVTVGFSGQRNLAIRAAASHTAWARQQAEGIERSFRDFHEEIVPVRAVSRRLSAAEKRNLEAVYEHEALA